MSTPAVHDGAGNRVHFSSYRSCVADLVPSGPSAAPHPLDHLFDAIIVPTHRSVDHLGPAAALAAAHGTRLVVLVSGIATTARVKRFLTRLRRAPQTLCIELPRHEVFPSLDFETSAQTAWMGDPDNDVATKRNIGLLLAARMGWRKVLFLDDDVRGFSSTDLARASAALDGYGAAGWAFSSFADNSVVCHAHRLAGGEQDTFIGAGALAVRIGPDMPFFPRAYNEDWLFLHPLMARGEVALLGDMCQIAYDPYRTALAGKQERGDVLAEGIFGLLHLGRKLADLDLTDWRDVVWRRRLFLDDIEARLLAKQEQHKLGEGVRLRVDRCLRAAQAELTPDVAPWLLAWTESWRRDLLRWEARLAEIETVPSVEDAVARLGLENCATEFGGHRHPIRPAQGWGHTTGTQIPAASMQAPGEAWTSPSESVPVG